MKLRHVPVEEDCVHETGKAGHSFIFYWIKRTAIVGDLYPFGPLFSRLVSYLWTVDAIMNVPKKDSTADSVAYHE